MESARYSCQILMILEFSRRVLKNLHLSNFMKIRPAGAEFHADGQTDRRDEANSCFRQFCERASKRSSKSGCFNLLTPNDPYRGRTA
jgi:hypothetical protein